MNRISQKDARKLLDEAAELVVALRSWGFHLPSSPLYPKDANTGKPLTDQHPFEKIEKLILTIRRKQNRVKEQ